MTTKFTPREAMRVAAKLGWEVGPKRKTGAISYRSTDGQTYTSAAPGRADRVPMLLAKALEQALSERPTPPPTAEEDPV